MDYAVITCFETPGDYVVRRLMRLLTENGVNNLYESVGCRPHIILSAFSTDNEATVREILQKLATEVGTIEVKFSSIGIFPGDLGVLYLVPTINGDLLQLHRQLHALIKPYCFEFSSLHIEPEWAPHCTLVLEMDPLEVPRAYSVLRDQFEPFTTRLTAFELITCCPFRTLQTLPFTITQPETPYAGPPDFT